MPGGPPAGWYDDPFGHADLRYFDGANWSSSVMQSGTDPVEAAVPAETVETDTAAEGTVTAEGGRPGRRMLLVGLVAAAVVVAGLAVAGLLVRGGSKTERVDTAPHGAPPTTVDLARIRAEYGAEVKRACEAISADLSLSVEDVFRSDERFEALPEFGPNAAVTECTRPAREAATAADEQRRAEEAQAAAAAAAEQAAAAAAAEQAAIDNAGLADVDTIVKNPDAVKGQLFRLTAQISQMDAATGPCVFRGNWDTTAREYNFEYAGDNGMFTTEPTVTTNTTCPLFDGVDQDDTVVLVVRGQGSYSYGTQIGGNTTVPLFQVLRVERVTKG